MNIRAELSHSLLAWFKKRDAMKTIKGLYEPIDCKPYESLNRNTRGLERFFFFFYVKMSESQLPFSEEITRRQNIFTSFHSVIYWVGA